MRAGVRKAGPLKKTPPFITPLTAPNGRAPNQGAATMHPPYLLLLLYYYNYYIKYKAQRAQNTKLVR